MPIASNSDVSLLDQLAKWIANYQPPGVKSLTAGLLRLLSGFVSLRLSRPVSYRHVSINGYPYKYSFHRFRRQAPTLIAKSYHNHAPRTGVSSRKQRLVFVSPSDSRHLSPETPRV